MLKDAFTLVAFIVSIVFCDMALVRVLSLIPKGRRSWRRL